MNHLTAIRMAIAELRSAYEKAQQPEGRVNAETNCLQAKFLIENAIIEMRREIPDEDKKVMTCEYCGHSSTEGINLHLCPV